MYTDSRSIQEDSTFIQTHPATLNIPQKGKTQGIRDCLQKIHIYTRLFQENLHVHATVKEKPAHRKKKEIKKKTKRQAETKFTPIKHY